MQNAICVIFYGSYGILKLSTNVESKITFPSGIVCRTPHSPEWKFVMRNQDIKHGISMSSLYFLSHFINLGHAIFKLSIWHVTDTLPGFGPLLGVFEASGKNFSKPEKK